jgi:hypothetical protein
MLEHRGKSWEPQVFAICMAWDAFRIALGGEPRHFTLREVIAWLTARTETKGH